ncbi:MAG: metallophosphoesterase [Bacteroidia bacterium]
MKFSVILIVLINSFLFISKSFAQKPEEPTFRLYLIGDAGEDDTTEATLLDLGKKLHENPNSAVVYLGDNCYKSHPILPVKMKGYDGSPITKARILSQLNILKGYKGSAYFIPGNHDWWNYTDLKKGKSALLLEETFIEKTLKGDAFSNLKTKGNPFIPDSGHPGPVVREFNDNKTRIIFIDSYRLILAEGDPKRDTFLLNTFFRNMKIALTEGTAKKQKIIVVAHHPIHAKGKHSLPLVAWQTMFRRIADANTNYPPYNIFALRLDSLLKEQHRPDIYYVAGHEHSLEYFFNDSLHYLVSGAGSKVDHVDYKETVTENEYFIWNEEGFFEIEFYGHFERVLMYHRKNLQSPLEVHCIAGCPVTKKE